MNEKQNLASAAAWQASLTTQDLPVMFRVPGVYPDAKTLEKLGRISVAWSSLDFAVRLAVKRIEGVGWQSARGKQIMKLRPGPLLEHFSAAARSQCLNHAERGRLATIHGFVKGRLTPIRDRALHSMWARSENGDLIHRRVGSEEFYEQKRLGPKTVSALIAQLERRADELIRLTARFVT